MSGMPPVTNLRSLADLVRLVKLGVIPVARTIDFEEDPLVLVTAQMAGTHISQAEHERRAESRLQGASVLPTGDFPEGGGAREDVEEEVGRIADEVVPVRQEAEDLVEDAFPFEFSGGGANAPVDRRRLKRAKKKKQHLKSPPQHDHSLALRAARHSDRQRKLAQRRRFGRRSISRAENITPIHDVQCRRIRVTMLPMSTRIHRSAAGAGTVFKYTFG